MTNLFDDIGVPVDKTNQWLHAGRAGVGAVARTLGCRPEHGGFDLYTLEPLGPGAMLAAHTAGEAVFRKVGRG